MAESNKATDDFLTQAAELSRVHDESPQEFLPAAARMRIAKRKAYYLVEIHKAFEGLPVDRERLLGIKWTKLQVLAPHVTKENVDELLNLAERLSTHLLKEAVNGSVPTSAKRCVLLYLSEDEYERLSEVLKSHGASEIGRGLHNKEKALMKALGKLKS